MIGVMDNRLGTSTLEQDPLAFLAGGGEMGERTNAGNAPMVFLVLTK
jgi:hypothetical protein